jgi:hypothetical protein
LRGISEVVHLDFSGKSGADLGFLEWGGTVTICKAKGILTVVKLVRKAVTWLLSGIVTVRDLER